MLGKRDGLCSLQMGITRHDGIGIFACFFVNRLNEGKQIRQLVPGCKIVLLCDENVSPDIAADVVAAKREGRIDAFYYSSVTGKYLVAALYAL